jgi:hypothetical protein
MVFNGTVFPTGGTSASTPTVAAIVALLNDHLIRQGKPVLGFLYVYNSLCPFAKWRDTEFAFKGTHFFTPEDSLG